MTLSGLKRVNNRQRGFTVVELLIAIAIAGILGTGIVMSVTQLFSGSAFSNNYNTAVNNFRIAEDWISRDGQMAQPSLTLDGGTITFPVSFIWYDYSDTQYEAIYSLSGTDLVRTYNVNGSTQSTTTIAQYITLATADYDEADNSLTVTINATKGDKSFQDSFIIHPRLQ